MGKYAENFIPLLLNIYGSEESQNEGIRLAALETVKVYLKVAPKDVTEKLLEDVTTQLLGEGTSSFQQQGCLDIASILLPWAPEVKLNSILERCRQFWTSKDHSLQKKSYRFLEELMMNEQKHIVDYVKKNVDALKKALMESACESKSPSKPARLRCFACLIKLPNDPDKEWMKAVFPEVNAVKSI